MSALKSHGIKLITHLIKYAHAGLEISPATALLFLYCNGRRVHCSRQYHKYGYYIRAALGLGRSRESAAAPLNPPCATELRAARP